MKKLSLLTTIILICSLAAQISAAPVFQDLPVNHWAKDAVAQLAAKGIIEGYSDGTFKGDRHITRWEMALMIARFVEKENQILSTFSTKEDLESLKSLINEFRSELDALGIRVANLDNSVSQITKRTQDLEKITFYGMIDSMVLTQGLKSLAASDPWGYGANSIYNVHNAIGSSIGPCIRPNGLAALINAAPPSGVYTAFPVVDFRNTRPLTNGTAFTTTGILGAKIKVSGEVDLKTEFAAYSLMGDSMVAPYGGITPPYFSNIFTSDVGLTALTNQSSLWTKISLDNISVDYKPNGSKIQIGSFQDTNFDHEMLYGEPNPNAIHGPRKLPFYGVRVTGKTNFLAPLKYEVLGSKVASGNTPANAAVAVYSPALGGFTLDWLIKNADIKISFLKAADEFFGRSSTLAGGTENPFGWQNPWEYRVAVAGLKDRPVQAGDGANGLIGPQSQTNMGLSFRYNLPNNINLEGVYNQTEYKPNFHSSYKANGRFAKIKLSASLYKKLLDVSAEYYGAGAFYDPFINTYAAVVSSNVAYGGAANLSKMPEPFYRFGLFSTGFYQMHNNEEHISNRMGVKLNAVYHFPKTSANIYAKYANLDQVAYSAAIANGGVSNKPGYVEGIFPAMTGGETTKGKYENLALSADYKTQNKKFYIKAGYLHHRFRRPTSLTNNFAANNNFNIVKGVSHILLNYQLNDKILLKGGYDYAYYKGTWRVVGLPNWDYAQNIPYIGFEYKINNNTSWALMAEQFNVGDYVSSAVTTSGGSWGWNGSRVYSEFKVTF